MLVCANVSDCRLNGMEYHGSGRIAPSRVWCLSMVLVSHFDAVEARMQPRGGAILRSSLEILSYLIGSSPNANVKIPKEHNSEKQGSQYTFVPIIQ
jgi:hypothetical protein